MKSAAWFLSPILAAVLLPQSPQQATPPPTTFNVNVRLVTVFVNVTDANNAPVANLTQNDFTLTEDNQPQHITYFDRESNMPLSIVLAVDESGSVYSDLKLEQDAAKHFVHALLRQQDELSLFGFDEQVHELVPFTSNLKKIDSGINKLHRGSATALYNAIYLASKALASQSLASRPAPKNSTTGPPIIRRKVIVLITDGDDTVRGVNYDQAVEQALRAEAMVFSIIIVPIQADAGRNTGGEHALIQMSADTGGKYYYVNGPHDPNALHTRFDQLSMDLRTQYLLGYYPTTTHPADGLHNIHIDLKQPANAGDKLHYRTGYYP